MHRTGNKGPHWQTEIFGHDGVSHPVLIEGKDQGVQWLELTIPPHLGVTVAIHPLVSPLLHDTVL